MIRYDRHQMDLLFKAFHTSFRGIVEGPASEEEKLQRVGRLIEIDEWCYEECLSACRKYDQAAADDLACDVLGRLCDGFRRGNRAVLAWEGEKAYFRRMFQTAAGRSKRRRPSTVELNHHPPGREPDPSEDRQWIEPQEVLELLIESIRRPKTKQIVRLRAEGVGFAEIAERLEMSVVAASKAFSRGVQEMRDSAGRLGIRCFAD